jgi:methionyl-tRNA formyltransferase
MQEYATISVKIPRSEREEMRKLKIKPSKVLREAVRRELMMAKIQKIKALRDRMDNVFDRLPSEFVTASIREDRDSR